MAIPGYRELTVLGRGGFSTVYRALQESVQREVALKVLAVHLAGADAKARFRREAATNGRVGNHPNIVTMFDSGFAEDGSPYLAMQLCSGGSLSERLHASGPLPLADVLRVGVKISAALQYAHSAGVLHRDIKPENILISDFGEPELADFGISSVDDQRMSTVTASSFTINHAAPEALAGQPSSVSSDVYSLCSTLFTLVAGHTPFNAPGSTGIYALINQVMNQPAPSTDRADVPASLERLLAAGLSKTPDERPADAKALGSALQVIQRETGLQVTEFPSAPPPLAHSPTQTISEPSSSVRSDAAGVGMAGVVAGAGIAAAGVDGLVAGGAPADAGPDGAAPLHTGALPPTGAMPVPTYPPAGSPADAPPTALAATAPAAGQWGAWASERNDDPRPAEYRPEIESAIPVPVSPVRLTPAATRPAPDRRAWWIIGASVLVLLLAGGIYFIATRGTSGSSAGPGTAGTSSSGKASVTTSTQAATSPTSASSSNTSTTTSTTSPTTTSGTPTTRSTTAATVDATISSFGSSSYADGDAVQCPSIGSRVTIPLIWSTSEATKSWIGIDGDTNDASKQNRAVPTGDASAPLPFTCSAERHTYTLTVQSESGRKTSKSLTLVRNLAATTTAQTSIAPATSTATTASTPTSTTAQPTTTASTPSSSSSSSSLSSSASSASSSVSATPSSASSTVATTSVPTTAPTTASSAPAS